MANKKEDIEETKKVSTKNKEEENKKETKTTRKKQIKEEIKEEIKKNSKGKKQEDKKEQEKFKTHMQIKHAKIQLKNYYHMVTKRKNRKNKEGENKWQE